jgi:hypothetical protein
MNPLSEARIDIPHNVIDNRRHVPQEIKDNETIVCISFMSQCITVALLIAILIFNIAMSKDIIEIRNKTAALN